MNRLNELNSLGQSVWLDYISKSIIFNGELKRIIKEYKIKGITSNPTIFQKAITNSNDYDKLIKTLSHNKKLNNKILYEKLAIIDIQNAADIMMPIYNTTKKLDGYVSLEVSPYLAYDTKNTINEAKRLWKTISRPNLMIKIPATNEGIDAIRYLISYGININITLLFSVNYYKKAINAFIEGLQYRIKKNKDISFIASVASFFISRIDNKIDKIIDKKSNKKLKTYLGQIAIANAKLAFQIQKKIHNSNIWTILAEKGAQKQRLLWASTSTKNCKYSDILYVENLIGKQTVNTISLKTLNAFQKYGKVQITIENSKINAEEIFNILESENILFEKITNDLLNEGIVLFQKAFDKILISLEKKQKF